MAADDRLRSPEACPDAEVLAEYADGRLTAAERAVVEAHLVDCADCRSVIHEAMTFAAQTQPASAGSGGVGMVIPFRAPRRWVSVAAGLAAAAALVLVVRVARPEWLGGWLGPRSDRPELQELVAALANEPTRPVEGRLTGGFKYAPPPSPTRGPGDREVSPDVRIAAAKIEKLARENDTPANRAALGVAYASLGDLERAVSELERAVRQEPTNARYQSDLSAIYLARARRLDRADEYPKAVAAAERAVQSDPKLVEAWFNRAFALEELHLIGEAKKAWNDSLRVEPTAAWSEEIRRHLAALDAQRPSARAISLGEWQQAAKSDDNGASLRQLAVRSHQSAREFLDGELLVEWGQDVLDGKTREATRVLESAQVLASVIGETGDRLPEAVVRRVSEAGGRVQQNLAHGHANYGRGRRLYQAGRFEESAKPFEEAAQLLQSGSDDFWTWAALYVAMSAYQGGKLATAGQQLQPLIDLARNRAYLNLLGRSKWILGLVHAARAAYTESLSDYQVALTSFQHTGEAENVASVHNLLAEILHGLGDRSEAWRHQIEAVATPGSRATTLYTIFLNATIDAMQHDLPEAGLHLQNAAVDAAVATRLPSLLTEAYLRRASVHQKLGASAVASEDFVRARSALSDVKDSLDAARLQAVIDGESAAVECGPPSSESIDRLSSAITYFAAQGRDRRLPTLYLRRGRCAHRQGAIDDAERDFFDGIRVFERSRQQLEEEPLKVSFLDENWNLYAEAARLLIVDKHQPLAAFAVAERSRSLSPLSLDLSEEVGRTAAIVESFTRVPPKTVVLYYLALPDRLVAWTISKGTWAFSEMPIAERQLGDLVDSYRDVLAAGTPAVHVKGRDLFDRLVRPALGNVARPSALVVVPDGALNRLPFASLVDDGTGHFVIEDTTVSLMPSWRLASRLFSIADGRRIGRQAPLRLIAFAGPGSAVDRLPPLPGAAAEVSEIQGLYSRAQAFEGAEATVDRFVRLAGSFDVVHFAGHSIVNDESPQMSRLVFHSGSPDRDVEVLFADRLRRLQLARTRVVVLSACDTGVGRVFHGEGSMSLARPFLLAGASSVVATLWKVDDQSTRTFAREFHRKLAAGVVPSQALQESQIGMLRTHAGSSAAWAAFVMFGV